MYYLSLVAYYIFFNASKIVYFLLLLLLGSFSLFILLEDIRNFQELAARAHERGTMTMAYMQFQETPARFDLNGSYILRVSSVLDLIGIR